MSSRPECRSLAASASRSICTSSGIRRGRPSGTSRSSLNAFSTFLSGRRLRRWSAHRDVGDSRDAYAGEACCRPRSGPRAGAVPARRMGPRAGVSGWPGVWPCADGGWLSMDCRREGVGALRRNRVSAFSSHRVRRQPRAPPCWALPQRPDGSLWARLRGPALVRFRDGAFENILPTVGLPGSIVTAMLRGRDGAMLLATVGEGAVSYRSGVTARVIAPRDVLGASFIISLAQMPDGQIWFGTRDAGLLRVDGSRAIAHHGGIAESEDQLPAGWRRGRSVDRHGPRCHPVEGWRNREVQESRKGWALYRRWQWFGTAIRTSGSRRVQAGSCESTVAA